MADIVKSNSGELNVGYPGSAGRLYVALYIAPLQKALSPM